MKQVFIYKWLEVKRHWQAVALALIVILSVGSVLLLTYSIRQNNELAAKSQQQIDCIFKDLKVPTTGNQHKYIASIASQCTIKIIQ